MAKFEVGVHEVIFDNQERILLAHRRDMDLWDLPGGGLDADELPTEGVIRETKEETGLDVEVVRFRYVTQSHGRQWLAEQFEKKAI